MLTVPADGVVSKVSAPVVVRRTRSSVPPRAKNPLLNVVGPALDEVLPVDNQVFPVIRFSTIVPVYVVAAATPTLARKPVVGAEPVCTETSSAPNTFAVAVGKFVVQLPVSAPNATVGDARLVTLKGIDVIMDGQEVHINQGMEIPEKYVLGKDWMSDTQEEAHEYAKNNIFNMRQSQYVPPK